MKKSVFIVSLAFFMASCTTVQRHTPTTVRPKVQAPTATAVRPGTTGSSAQQNAKGAVLTAAPTPESLAKSGASLEALKLLCQTNPAGTRQPWVFDIIDSKLDLQQVETVSSDSEYQCLRPMAYFRLGQNALEAKEFRSAKKYYEEVVDLEKDTDLGLRAQEYIVQIENYRRVEPQSIGVILPLSGKNAPLGQKALRAVQIGLGLHQPTSNFKLAVIDSEGNADVARRGVERLVQEDNVIAIIGSMLSKTATAVAAKANELGVPSIGLSQKSGLTEIGDIVFRNSLTSEMQVRELVRVARAQNMQKFAILYPNDAYGVEYANIFWDEVLARGGQITSIQSYNPQQTDFRYTIQRLVGTYYIEARLDEYKQKSKDFFEANKKMRHSRQNLNLDDILPPLVDFDAIFIPDSSKVMSQLAAFLSYSGVKDVKLLGTNLWNVPGLARRAGHFANQLLFVDGLWAGGAEKNTRFYQEYKSTFNEDPGFLEFQAYDSALLLRQMILEGADSRERLARKLSQLEKFPGALGELRLNSRREILRPVVTLTVDKSGDIRPLNVIHKKN